MKKGAVWQDRKRNQNIMQKKSAVTQLKENPDNLELLWDAMVAFAGYPFFNNAFVSKRLVTVCM